MRPVSNMFLNEATKTSPKESLNMTSKPSNHQQIDDEEDEEMSNNPMVASFKETISDDELSTKPKIGTVK